MKKVLDVGMSLLMIFAFPIATAADLYRFNGSLQAEYACGPPNIPGTRSVAPFRANISLKFEQGKISGVLEQGETIERFYGQVSSADAIFVGTEGYRKEEPTRSWVDRFDGNSSESPTIMAGGMYLAAGTKIRDCTLTLFHTNEKVPDSTAFGGPAAAIARTTNQFAAPTLETDRAKSSTESSSSTAAGSAVAIARTTNQSSAPIPDRNRANLSTESVRAPAPQDGLSAFPPWLGAVAPRYPTERQLIDATRRGELLSVERVIDPSKNADEIVSSLAVILANEYHTAIPDDSKKGGGCSTARRLLLDIIKRVTERSRETLGNR